MRAVSLKGARGKRTRVVSEPLECRGEALDDLGQRHGDVLVDFVVHAEDGPVERFERIGGIGVRPRGAAAEQDRDGRA